MRHRSRLSVTRLEDRYTPTIDTAVVGRTLFVAGTEGDDTFGFAAGTQAHLYSLNGEVGSVDASLVDEVVFNGHGGDDRADLTTSGIGDGNVAALVAPGGPGGGPGYGMLRGDGYTVWVDARQVYAVGGASDVAYLAGSEGKDSLVAERGYALLAGNREFDAPVGPEFFSGVSGFGAVGAFGNGGDDVANLGASAVEYLAGGPSAVTLYFGRPGPADAPPPIDAVVTVSGFELVRAYVDPTPDSRSEADLTSPVGGQFVGGGFSYTTWPGVRLDMYYFGVIATR